LFFQKFHVDFGCMADFLNHLFTPCRSQGHFGSQYQPKKGTKGTGLALAEVSKVHRTAPSRKLGDPNSGNAQSQIELALQEIFFTIFFCN